jgi:NAD(P)-dependent dehydrogenase (short-subunit alcohol dehydrogenase family)
MSICITGWRSKIAEEFRALIPGDEEALWGKPLEPDFPRADRYLFCQGLLRPKRMEDQTQAERDESWLVNYISIATWCDWIFASNPRARVCVIGSESAYRGSFDEAYAVSKAALHRYVEGRKIGPNQQLICISPGIIEDAGMTTRRKDTGNVIRRKALHPMKRFATSREVAELAYHLLYRQAYVSGTVVRMHGGLK